MYLNFRWRSSNLRCGHVFGPRPILGDERTYYSLSNLYSQPKERVNGMGKKGGSGCRLGMTQIAQDGKCKLLWTLTLNDWVTLESSHGVLVKLTSSPVFNAWCEDFELRLLNKQRSYMWTSMKHTIVFWRCDHVEDLIGTSVPPHLRYHSYDYMNWHGDGSPNLSDQSNTGTSIMVVADYLLLVFIIPRH